MLKDYNNGNQSVHDKLYKISKINGGGTILLGEIRGLGASSRKAEDIEHDPNGRLFVTDNHDDETYEVNPNTGEIISVTDQSQKNGLGLDSDDTVKFEALGWDFGNDILVGNDDDNEVIARLTLQDGNNLSYGDTEDMGLTDVEGIDFVPTPDGEPIDPTTVFAD